MNASAYAALEARLQYAFTDRALLETALTHPSFGSDHHVPHYQRLEFLGDAVFELAVSRMLYERYPDMPEGQLTRVRAELVREESLSTVARALDLGTYIRLSPGEVKTGGARKASILCDVMESVVAAVYLDGGYDAASALVCRLLEDAMPAVAAASGYASDAKSRLQEIMQRGGGANPEYELIGQDGPAHRPVFTMCVTVAGRELARGAGASKREAQQNAAREAINKMDRRD